MTNETVDQTFGVHDRRLGRQDPLDPSSPSAMARLVELRDQFDIALANTPMPTATAS